MTETTSRIAQTLTERVAAEVRAEAARQNASQYELAEVLKVAQPNVSRRLNGKQPFDTDELDKLAAHWGIPVDRFLQVPTPAVA